MSHRVRTISVGIFWWLLGVMGLYASLGLIWPAAARLGIVHERFYGGWTGYYGEWANVIGFSCIAALALGVLGITIAVIMLSRRGRLPGARDTHQQRGFAVERSKEAIEM